MFIYTVQPGDSVFHIAAKFQVSMSALSTANGVANTPLIPGESLFIPSSVYIVQPGDSLYTLSQMSFTSESALRAANRLPSDNLTPGMRLYIPPRPKYPIEGLSYLVPTTPSQDQSMANLFATYNAYYGIFEYHFYANGDLSTLDDSVFVAAARNNHVAPLATITNLTAQGFSGSLASQVLNSPSARQRLINNILYLRTSHQFAGVNVDFEEVLEGDRDAYTGFLHQLKQALSPRGYYTSVALPPKTSDNVPWLRGYDYGGIGSVVDFAFIMAYDFHEAHTQPGPVAPITGVTQTIEYTLQYMRANKIILGVPRYGYDWILDANGTATSASAVSVSSAVQTARQYQVPIQFSTQDQQPYFRYQDTSGRSHVVWFEDARARAAKFQLVVNYRLRGVGAWQLQFEFPQAIPLIQEFFTPKKII